MAAKSTPSTSTAGPTLTLPDLGYLISSERRIHIIDVLAASNDEWITQADLATRVAERTTADRKRIYGSLYHSHLPKLAEFGIIEHDTETNEVRRGPRFQNVLNARNAVALSQGVSVDE